MLGTQLAQLQEDTPVGLSDADTVVAGFDDALVSGFARVGDEAAAALAALADAVAGTPLGARVADAVDTVTAGGFRPDDLAVLAGARSALLGAAHDALLGRFDAAVGRDRALWTAPAGASAETSAASSAAGAWLHEVAVAGWRNVDHELLSAAGSPVEAALAEPRLRRLAVLLDGLAAELRASLPVATMPQVPARRWADLWTRAVLLAQDRTGPLDDGERVSGRLLPLGVDVHEHATAVQVQVHAVLEPSDGGPARLVRTAVAAGKVETITGPAVWRLLPAYPVLLAAVAQRRTVTVTRLPLRGGDLSWCESQARLGEHADPFATGRLLLADVTAAATAPLDRHPAAIAEPVLLEGYRMRKGDDGLTLDRDGQSIGIAVDRLPAAGPLTAALVTASTSCLGLARWDDGRWWVQPLAVQATVKRAPVEAHNGDWAEGVTDPKVAKAEARAGDAVAVLRERAGRLLRR
ncbi:hypothetical protein [Micromonospora craniellae]|uniref:Uncharacterized protein n=1 Tax=Micromonospora craniellae TaxID=2294034 RepID=A0A372G301_9ACTN|nr:hypothetical protein [Micromonospora craniellae]QOC92103.1 hypothetical protein ID554_30355 [Micromonospora craniellae]RFS47441.1 hypothetical protein D0Q02_05420 [Micromonospora craniellae]